MMETIRKHLALVIAFSAVMSILYGLDGRWAKADHLAQLEQRLDQKIDMDRAKNLQERIWRLEDKYPDGDRPPEIRKECRELHHELKMINDKWGIK